MRSIAILVFCAVVHCLSVGTTFGQDAGFDAAAKKPGGGVPILEPTLKAQKPEVADMMSVLEALNRIESRLENKRPGLFVNLPEPVPCEENKCDPRAAKICKTVGYERGLSFRSHKENGMIAFICYDK